MICCLPNITAGLNLFLGMFYNKSGGWLFESFGQFMTSHKGGLGSVSQKRLFKFIADKNICSLKNVPEEVKNVSIDLFGILKFSL